jgi:hypothetical protein
MRKEIIEIQVTGTEKGTTQIKELDKSLKSVGNSAKNSNKDTKDLGDTALEGAKGFKFMGVSINQVSAMLKVLKVSLIATGIGAIIVAVGALASAFLSTQAGVDALNSVLTPLKEVLSTIWGITQKLGTGLFEMVSGNVQKGWKTMGDSVSNVGDQMDKAWRNGKKLYELQKKISENAINDGLVISRLNRLNADSLSIAEDTTNTVKERQNAFKAAMAAQAAITKLQTIENDNQIALAKGKTKANDTDNEAKKALNDLIAKGENIKADGAKALTLLTKKLNVVKGEAPDAPEKETGKRKKVIPIGTQLANDQEIINNADQIKELKDRETQDRLAAYREQIRQEDLLAQQTQAEQEEILRQQKVQGAINVLDALTGLAGAETDIGRALLLAKQVIAAKELILSIKSTIMAARESTTKSLLKASEAGVDIAAGAGKTAAAAPFPANIPLILGYAATAIGIIGSVKAALSKQKSVASQFGGGGGGGIESFKTPQAQSPSFNVVGQSGTNQLAESIGGQSKEPIKAYVVSKDMSSQQELDRNTQKTATFG